ncbi:MAG: geranylgeranylglycerol-phosphate geranylgeranyltransferase [Candidatus Heimdallarchaeota archaeon]
MNPWIRIMRPFNCFLITMCAIVGIMVDQGIKTFKHWPSLILIAIGGWALSAAAMVLNDFFDVDIDRINDPSRPIPSGQITPKQAMIFGIVLIVIGNLAGISIDVYEWLVFKNQFGVSIVTAIICTVMLTTYTPYMKKYSVLGNLAVSVGVWMGFLYGDLVFDFSINPLPEAMALAAFMLNFGREVMKGIIDIEGDRENGVTTIATAFGDKLTAIIASILYFIAIASCLTIPILLANASVVYLGSISVPVILATISIVWVLSDQRIPTVRKIKTIILYTMLVSLVAFTLEAFLGDLVGPLIGN